MDDCPKAFGSEKVRQCMGGGGCIPLSLERPWRKISLLKSHASIIIWFGEEVKMEVMCV